MDKISPSKTALDLAKRVLAIEAEAIRSLGARLGETFLDAVELLLNCKGRVVVRGIRKSGHIARKIASTPRTIGPDKLAAEAVQIMEEHKVSQLLVVTGDGTLIGALNMHDLFRTKVI